MRIATPLSKPCCHERIHEQRAARDEHEEVVKLKGHEILLGCYWLRVKVEGDGGAGLLRAFFSGVLSWGFLHGPATSENTDNL